MGDSYISEGMLEVFLYESETMLESMEQLCMENEETPFDDAGINEMFRSMHTIKGSSAIMLYNNITTISHKLEDIFYYIRESHPENVDQKKLVDNILKVTDFIKGELDKIKAGDAPDGDETGLLGELDGFLNVIKTGITDGGAELPAERVEPEVKQFYVPPVSTPDSKFFLIQVFFKSYVEMQNIKAYTMVYSLKEAAEDLIYEPEDIMTSEESSNVIANEGFFMALQTQLKTEEIMSAIDHCGGTSHIDIHEVSAEEYSRCLSIGSKKYFAEKESAGATPQTPSRIPGAAEAMEAPAPRPFDPTKDNPLDKVPAQPVPEEGKKQLTTEKLVQSATKPKEVGPSKQAFISVNVTKMDALMDLIGELVIAEAVVLQNPDLKVPGLDLSNFQKAASQLSKISGELQDVIMSMRMMPLNPTFQKMKRIVHDVSGKLGKDVELRISGEDTEVDKNIIEHISDPLMHLIRNSVDHGIETPEERALTDKPAKGVVTLEAKNEGGKVWISVSDDGKGLSREKIYNKAVDQGLILDPDKEYSDKEIFAMITKPGFSTKEEVTEYSGRGVGMDVVVQNIQSIGGSLDIESVEGQGSRMTLKIPLTLAIIDGILLDVGGSSYAIATGNVKEFIRATKDQIIVEPEGAEALLLRGECLPILRLKEYYGLNKGVDEAEDGIFTIVEHEGRHMAVLVDRLIGEQEIVVKPLPTYIGKIKGLSGCTQLGDGSISLILDAGSLLTN